jgi:anaerobic glycerol-3-phosphate dehydrogenase
MDIKRAIFLLDNSNLTDESFRDIKGLLTELGQRRESDLRPANKFLRNSKLGQFAHMANELIEINDELFNNSNIDIEKVTEEIVDLQMSCETMLAIFGLDEQQRMSARRKVVEKNEKRGYYEDGGK